MKITNKGYEQLFRSLTMGKEGADETYADDSDDEQEEEASNGGTGIFVTEVGPADVLLGRGTGPANHQGNVRFRVRVESMKPEYVATASRRSKNKLVRELVDSIKVDNGRFLRKLSRSQARQSGQGDSDSVYEVVPDCVAVGKTKQAIRYVHYKKEPHERAVQENAPKKEGRRARKKRLARENGSMDMDVESQTYSTSQDVSMSEASARHDTAQGVDARASHASAPSVFQQDNGMRSQVDAAGTLAAYRALAAASQQHLPVVGQGLSTSPSLLRSLGLDSNAESAARLQHILSGVGAAQDQQHLASLLAMSLSSSSAQPDLSLNGYDSQHQQLLRQILSRRLSGAVAEPLPATRSLHDELSRLLGPAFGNLAHSPTSALGMQALNRGDFKDELLGQTPGTARMGSPTMRAVGPFGHSNLFQASEAILQHRLRQQEGSSPVGAPPTSQSEQLRAIAEADLHYRSLLYAYLSGQPTTSHPPPPA